MPTVCISHWTRDETQSIKTKFYIWTPIGHYLLCLWCVRGLIVVCDRARDGFTWCHRGVCTCCGCGVCVWERECESETERLCTCVWERVRESVGESACVTLILCVCECVHAATLICVCVCVCVRVCRCCFYYRINLLCVVCACCHYINFTCVCVCVCVCVHVQLNSFCVMLIWCALWVCERDRV